jgi:hypothetical protein
MSSALILASVTAVIRNLLENGLVERGVTSSIGSDTSISALPLDRIETGTEEKAQINLFLYQVTPRGLYSISRHTPERNGHGPGLPLALELRYLVTAFCAQDFQTEILLGYALEVLHEKPDIEGEEIRSILSSISSEAGGRVVLPALAAMSSSELKERFVSIKICPQTVDSEEMMNLWSSFQVCYRPSIVYRVDVTLTNGHKPYEVSVAAQPAPTAEAPTTKLTTKPGKK